MAQYRRTSATERLYCGCSAANAWRVPGGGYAAVRLHTIRTKLVGTYNGHTVATPWLHGVKSPEVV